MDDIELSVHRADERLTDERSAGMHGTAAYMAPGTHYIYWRDPTTMRRRAVYNIPSDAVQRLTSLIRQDPSARYLAIVGDVPGAAFGDEHAKIHYNI